MFNIRKHSTIEVLASKYAAALKPLSDVQVKVLFDQIHELEEDAETYLVRFCMVNKILNVGVLQDSLYAEVAMRPKLADVEKVA